jgi:hypothetical protein
VDALLSRWFPKRDLSVICVILMEEPVKKRMISGPPKFISGVIWETGLSGFPISASKFISRA